MTWFTADARRSRRNAFALEAGYLLPPTPCLCAELPLPLGRNLATARFSGGFGRRHAGFGTLGGEALRLYFLACFLG